MDSCLGIDLVRESWDSPAVVGLRRSQSVSRRPPGPQEVQATWRRGSVVREPEQQLSAAFCPAWVEWPWICRHSLSCFQTKDAGRAEDGFYHTLRQASATDSLSASLAGFMVDNKAIVKIPGFPARPAPLLRIPVRFPPKSDSVLKWQREWVPPPLAA